MNMKATHNVFVPRVDEHLNGAQKGERTKEVDDCDVPVPTLNGVEEAIHQLKSRKAVGKDRLELFKMGS